MNGLIMDYPLTIPAILRRAERHFGPKSILSRLPDKSLHRYDYAALARRSRKLAVALARLGVRRGDRVGTFCWNHYRHLEAYFGIPGVGAVLHTLNLRLHPDDLVYIANHAGDKVIIVDDVLWPLFEKFRAQLEAKHIVVAHWTNASPPGTLDYEAILADADEDKYAEPELDEREAAAMCYTSGTTGKPKGVLYSHRALALHSMAGAMVDMLGICERDMVVPVVPMFHANAWALPYVATMTGAEQAFPGPFLDPESLLELFEKVRATVTAGVPTIWMGILALLDSNPKRFDVSSLRQLIVGGSAAPRAMIEGFQERHGLRVVQAWGMTELSPMGTVSHVPSGLEKKDKAVHYARRAKQGMPAPFIEVRARGEAGLIPWDGKTTGELEVRGPWVASEYFEHPEPVDSFTKDGWFRTGDIVSIEPDGCIEIQDRAKDVIKSGGEWISSVALENALMGHPKVAEAAVVAVPHGKWQERPLAVVVPRPGQLVTSEELTEHLAAGFAKWWLPDAYVFIDEIPRTSAGKFKKSVLRERFRDYPLPDRAP